MKKNFKYFALVWFVELIILNALTFIIPRDIFGFDRFDRPTFWITYAFITVALVGKLISAYVVCSKDTANRVFLNIPILSLGYSLVSTSVAVGIVFMLAPIFAAWIGALVCILIMAFYVIACVKATALANIVDDMDKEIKATTSFMKSMVDVVEGISSMATTVRIKTEIKKVYEALRYSDYVSTTDLELVEIQIEDHVKQLKLAVENQDLEMVQAESNQLLILIKDRNIQCKASK